jgi:hypothetical protein
LHVECIAAIFGREQRFLVRECQIVEGDILQVAENEERYLTVRLCKSAFIEINPEDRAKRAAGSKRRIVAAMAFVSPVGSEKKVRKFEPGSQAKFSGRLKGVAPAAFASALASNAAVSPALEIWMVTHLIG